MTEYNTDGSIPIEDVEDDLNEIEGYQREIEDILNESDDAFTVDALLDVLDPEDNRQRDVIRKAVERAYEQNDDVERMTPIGGGEAYTPSHSEVYWID